jgi:C1A family cysteine protease
MGATVLSAPLNVKGWIPDKKDPRDYTLKMEKPRADLPTSYSLRDLDSPIMDQGQLGSCTANAGCGLLQFLQNANSGRYTPVSRLYLYKFTRMIMNTNGDTGASLRDTMMAMVMHGVPPETYWNYNIARFDEMPQWRGSEVFLSNMADNYEGGRYIRLDPDGVSPLKVLDDIKLCINSKMPSIFGTLVYQGILGVNTQGDIPVPQQGEQPIGGHALMIIGYDDTRGCLNTNTKGAFLIRNSWSSEWGDKGYGWLPYEYLMNGAAQDFWTL